MPACVFTCPEIASVGPGEEEWIRRGVGVVVKRSRYVANGRAMGLGESEGMLKLIASAADGKLIGVQIVGRDASSLVGEALVAVNEGLKASRLGEMIHPHPTLCELFMEAGEDYEWGSIHG
jgi:dihydrolipoamide dehydrogenase